MNHYNYSTKWQALLPPLSFWSRKNELLCIFKESQTLLVLQVQASLFVLRTSTLYLIWKSAAALNRDQWSAATTCKVLCFKSSRIMNKQGLEKGRNVHMDITWRMESHIYLIFHFSILDL